MTKERKTESFREIRNRFGLPRDVKYNSKHKNFRKRFENPKKSEFKVIKGFSKYSRQDHIYARRDDYKTGQGTDLIKTGSLTSCLGITLYNPETKKGALAHIDSEESSKEELKPENVIDTLLNAIDVQDNYQNLEASLAGESISFRLEKERNSHKVREILKNYNIPIIGEELKPHIQRKLLFLNCSTGKVEVYRA